MKYPFSEYSLFKNVDSEIIEELINKYAKIKSYKAGEFVFVKGDKPQYMFIIVSGSVSVFSDDSMGKRELFSTFDTEGTLFAEVYLYLNKETYDYFGEADEDTTLIEIGKDFFMNLYLFESETGKTIIENYLRILSEKLYYLNQKLKVVSGLTLRQKISRYFLQNRDENMVVNLKYNREELADYLGVTRPSLSREFSKMKAEGLIEIEKNKIIIKKVEELNKNF